MTCCGKAHRERAGEYSGYLGLHASLAYPPHAPTSLLIHNTDLYKPEL